MRSEGPSAHYDYYAGQQGAPYLTWYIFSYICIFPLVCYSQSDSIHRSSMVYHARRQVLAAEPTPAPSQISALAVNTEQAYPQCFSWSFNQSVAGANYSYLPTGSSTLQEATLGELIPFKCSSVVCPNPPTPNCFYDDTVCSDQEWCMLDAQSLWGPWAMGSGGQTPGASGHAGIQCADAQAANMTWWFDTVCGRNSSWGPFIAERGRCVPYRTEQQSCLPELTEVDALYGPLYPLQENGKPYARPLRCAPGLICTGDVGPTPFTCVRKRPANVCFQGPWWDSTTWCKIGGSTGNDYTAGLPQDQLESAAPALMLQLPQDNYKPLTANFWYAGLANRTREQISRVVETLWPEVYRPTTIFPLSYPDPRTTGPPYTSAWNDTAQQASSIMTQTPRVWSTIHTLIHNALDPMPTTQIWASRAIAMFLLENFQCGDCRGSWSAEVLAHIGLPPDSSSREEHQKWWWKAHNMVSEHTASTRGGQFWIYNAMTSEEFTNNVGIPAGNPQDLNCQNPFFLSYPDAVSMWKIAS